MGVATIHYLHPYRDCITITYIKNKLIKTIHCVIYYHGKWLSYRKRTHQRNAYTRVSIRRLTRAISLFNR